MPVDKSENENREAAYYAELLAKDQETELCRALLACETRDECRAFLTDICTRQEIAALSERLLIARLLGRGGMSYREISSATGASTTTVGRVARFLTQEPHRGYQLILKRIEGIENGTATSTDE